MNNMTAAHILAFPILSLYFSSFHPSAVLCLQLISTMCSTEFAGKLFHCKAICPSFHLLPIPLPQLKPKPLAARAHLSLWHSGKRGSLPSPLSAWSHIEYRKKYTCALLLWWCFSIPTHLPRVDAQWPWPPFSLPLALTILHKVRGSGNRLTASTFTVIADEVGKECNIYGLQLHLIFLLPSLSQDGSWHSL